MLTRSVKLDSNTSPIGKGVLYGNTQKTSGKESTRKGGDRRLLATQRKARCSRDRWHLATQREAPCKEAYSKEDGSKKIILVPGFTTGALR